MCRPCEKIFGYPCWQLSAPLHEAPATEGQAREAVTYFYRTLPSTSEEIGRNAMKLDLPASMSIHPVFNVSLTQKVLWRQTSTQGAVQVKDDAEYEIDSILHHWGHLHHQ